MLPTYPLVDIKNNPFYCPTIPARAYIHSLHRSLKNARSPAIYNGTAPLGNWRASARHSFARILALTLRSPRIGNKTANDNQDREATPDVAVLEPVPYSKTLKPTVRSVSEANGTDDYQPDSVSSRREKHLNDPDHSCFGNSSVVSDTDNNIESLFSTRLTCVDTLRPAKRRKTDSYSESESNAHSFSPIDLDAHLPALSSDQRNFLSSSSASDLRGPTHHAKSILVTSDQSFEVRIKRETLEFDVTSDSSERVAFLHPDSPGITHPASRDSLRNELQKVLPGVSLPDSALYFENIDSMAAYLSENGLLTTPVMRILGQSSVGTLTLSSSMEQANGLNLGGATLLSELHTPGTFAGLRSLVCSYVPLADQDVLQFHHLSLERLVLTGTDIGNEAVFLLTSLKKSLRRLDINDNRRINDDAIPALIMLHLLTHLSIDDTEISVVGIRRFAKAIYEEGRSIDVEIPDVCREYFEKHSCNQYLVDPPPPLVSKPEQCKRLTIAELKHNLVAHAVVNKGIMTSGTKAELIERLERLLKTREEDSLVKQMLQYEKE